jgi:predicted nuclease of predicted toxin-antitoxin system
MKILIDMNLSPKWADCLINNGIEAVHWVNIGMSDARDDEIMTYARNNDFIVMTCDLDFGTILANTHHSKPSIVQIRTQNFNINQMAEMVSSALMQNEYELQKGAVLTIDAKKWLFDDIRGQKSLKALMIQD